MSEQSSQSQPAPEAPHKYISALGHHSQHFVKERHWVPVVIVVSAAILLVAAAVLLSGRKLSPQQLLQSLSGPVIQLDDNSTEGGDVLIIDRQLDTGLTPAARNDRDSLLNQSNLTPAERAR